MEPETQRRTWTLLTGHGHVLVEIARNPEATMRQLGDAAGPGVAWPVGAEALPGAGTASCAMALRAGKPAATVAASSRLQEPVHQFHALRPRGR